MGAHTSSKASAEGVTGDAAAALDAIRRIVRALRVSSRALERELGISGAQLFVLEQLAATQVQSVGELAERTVTDQSSVSVVVSRLVDKKLASRTPSKADARRAEIALTAKGRALLRKAPPPAQVKLLEGIVSMKPHELEGLVRGLEHLVEALGVGDERAAMFFEEDIAERAVRKTNVGRE